MDILELLGGRVKDRERREFWKSDNGYNLYLRTDEFLKNITFPPPSLA